MRTPQELMQAVQAAYSAYERGDLAAARAGCEAVLKDAPGEPNASQVLALALMQQGEPARAVPHLQNAIKAQPNHPPIRNILGVALGLIGKRAEARAQFEKVKTLDPNFIDARFNLAQVEIDDGAYDRANAEFDAILAKQPANPEALSGRAKTALLQQDIDAAFKFAHQALIFDPANSSAQLTLAEAKLRRNDFADARRIALEAANRPGVTPINRAYALGFAADAADRLGLFDEAFANYSESNKIQAGLNRALADEPPSSYSPETLRRLIEFMDGGAGDAPPLCGEGERSPAFLIGFPRSGTTLLEQVLLAHPRVASFGEQPALERACADLVLGEEGLARLAHLDEGQAAAYRTRYWDEVAALGCSPGEGQLYLDKMPTNTAFLPVIAKVFPHANILFALRDPRDVVLSCFQQRFVMNPAMFQMLSLESAARYYDLVMTLAVRARGLYDFPLREVRYDDIVADLEGEARGVIAFLGLPWDPAVLEYREGIKVRTVKTPSVAQVAEPVYRRALGKWRNYEQFMAPVRPLLDPWAERYNYT